MKGKFLNKKRFKDNNRNANSYKPSTKNISSKTKFNSVSNNPFKDVEKAFFKEYKFVKFLTGNMDEPIFDFNDGEQRIEQNELN